MSTGFYKKYRHMKYILVIIPSLVAWFTFSVYPNLEVFVLGFYKWNGISKVKEFVGWENFGYLINDLDFSQGVMNSIFYILFLFLFQTVLSLLLAVILKNNTTHNKFFKTFFFLPLVFSSVMVGLTWGYMYDPNLGIINTIMTNLGFKSFEGFDWLFEPTRGVLCVVLVHIWANIGYPLTIITAGLNSISDTLYEAAHVEGASRTRAFMSITIPLLMPTLLRISMLTLSTGALAFDYVFLLGSTMQASPFDTISVRIYKSLSGDNLGMPAAMGSFLGVVLMMIFVLQFVITKKVEDSVN